MTTNENAMKNMEVALPTPLNPIHTALNTNIYAKWKIDGLEKMKEKARHNVSHRSNKIKSIVNEIVRVWCKNASPFIINDEFEELALNKLFTKFENWTGVNINACKNGIVDWSEYWDRADNWFNRNKGQWFGDYYFYPIFNTYLKQYCYRVSNSMYPNNTDKKECFYSLLYVEILKRISSENIRFKQTRPQSLVIDQSLIQSNLLQNFLLTFSTENGIVWLLPKTKSAKLYRESWRECIDGIYKQTHAIYCLIFNQNKENANINKNPSLYTSVVNNKPIISTVNNESVNAPISWIPQPVTYCIVPINYGVIHNSNQYVANARYHPYSATNLNNNNNGYLVNALLLGNNQNNINLNPFTFIQRN